MVEALYLLIQGIMFFWLISLARDRSRFLYWIGLLIPLNSISFEWLSLWSWAKLAVVVAVAGLIMSDRTRSQASKLKIPVIGMSSYTTYLAYSAVLTLVWIFYDEYFGFRNLTAASFGWGAAQSTFRYPVQLFNFLTQWGIVFIGVWFAATTRDAKACIRGFIHGNLVNAVTGFYQVLALYVGLPWFKGSWILRLDQFNPDISRSGWANLGSISLPRLSGLGGEPKHAGANFVIAIFLMLLLISNDRFDTVGFVRRPRLIMVLLMSALVLTFSVGSWAAFLLAFSYFLVVGLGSKAKASFVPLFLVVLFGLTIVAAVGKDSVFMVFDKYVGLKISEPSISKYPDYTILNLLAMNPFNLFFGRGAGGADFWLLDIVESTGRPISPAYAITRLVAEQGILGILLVSFAIVRWARMLLARGLAPYAHFLVGGFLIVLTSHVLGLYGFLLVSGCLVAVASRQDIELSSTIGRTSSPMRSRYFGATHANRI